MAHELEFVNGKASMAYSGDTPWHGLGVKVPADLTPQQMLEAANLDWKVEKHPVFANINGVQVDVGRKALVRDRDQRVLDVISDDWQPCQNEEAFEFFNDFVAAGEMEMHTAGSLKDGKIVWALAKINESFELFGGRDKVDSYLLFTNPHSYGQSIDIRMTGVRVVCNNTLSMSLGMKSKNVVKVSHRNKLNLDLVKETIGVAKERLAAYKEAAEYLSQKRFTNENVVDYFTRIFPVSSASDKPLSRNAQLCLDVMDTQPGAEFGEGTWWQAFNACTYNTNHLAGRSDDTRLQSVWYGQNKNINERALNLALEMAEGVRG